MRALPDRRPILFAVLLLACTAIAVGYAVRSAQVSTLTLPPALDTPADATVLARIASQPHLVFLHSPGGDAYRQVAIVPLDGLDGPRYLTPLICQRVYMVAGGGLCMDAGPKASAFNAQFQPGGAFPQPGIPTRARVSSNGDLGSMTWFVEGHSYADASFSTQTVLVDLRTGATLADLEQFTILKDGVPFRRVDFNFWGVTFTRDASQFYATLATGGRTYLIRGDVARREATVMRENAECPSLSPDNTRLVFKKRVDPSSPNQWRLAVLDLTSMEESMVPGEDHSVDDQAEWLDDNHILYALLDFGPPATIAQNIWEASLDGSEPPHMILKGALSPAVVR